MGRSPSPPRRRDDRRREDRRDRDRDRDRRRQRTRSRSRSLERRRRSPDRRRSPSPRRRRSRSISPIPTSSFAPKPKKTFGERPIVTPADLEGKTPEEQEMLKVMGFCGFDTTKARLPIPMNAFGLQMYRQTGAADMADTLDAGAPVSTTLLVAPSTPATLTSAPTTAAADPLEKYQLSDFVWVSLLLRPGEDAIHLKTNTTDETLKLSKDDVAPKPASGTDAECLNALAGTGAGSCVYLTRCDAARAIATAEYLGSYCSVDGFAGVCCPKASVDVGKTD